MTAVDWTGRPIHRWQFWRITGWVASKLYALGITSNGGATCWDGHSGRYYRLPRWDLNRRVYVLGIRTDRWRCVLRYHHWPTPWEVGFGMCGKCCPWPCCGAITVEHLAGCAEALDIDGSDAR